MNGKKKLQKSIHQVRITFLLNFVQETNKKPNIIESKLKVRR